VPADLQKGRPTVAYLDQAQGKPPAELSSELLEIDETSGPWLAETQRKPVIAQDKYPRWDLDLAEEVIWFGDEERQGIVARVHTIGSYSVDDGVWVWAWTNEELARPSAGAQQVCEDHSEVPEFGLTLIKGDETMAWTLAAAVAHLMGAEACYRLPGALQMFVALTDITPIDPSDPRAKRPLQDSAGAAAALGEFAGPAALRIGGLVVETLKDGQLDKVIDVLYRFCERLEEMATSPVGQGTPAASEATEHAGQLRQAALSLSVPPGHPALAEAVKGLLDLLERIARQYGAWPEESPSEAN